jgi:hypothetical protein
MRVLNAIPRRFCSRDSVTVLNLARASVVSGPRVIQDTYLEQPPQVPHMPLPSQRKSGKRGHAMQCLDSSS